MNKISALASSLICGCLIACVATKNSPPEGAYHDITGDEREFFDQFCLITRVQVEQEVEGEPPGGGARSWEDHWRRRIEYLTINDFPGKYVDFILSERRTRGLRAL